VDELAHHYFHKGFKTIAITDHGKGLRISKIKDVDAYFQDIETAQKEYPQMKILKGLEANVDKDGNLDYTEAELEKFDWVIASIHFNMEGDQTERLVKAINNKNVKVMGHITCEEYGVRKGITADWTRIFDECVKNNVRIEINGADSRIFLSNELIQVAKKKGIKFTFGSDTHGIPNNMLTTSLWRAQRAGLTVEDFHQC
jgi:DNA polymerase (family 10)